MKTSILLSPTRVRSQPISLFRSSEPTGLPSSLLLIPDAGYIMEDSLPAVHDRFPDEQGFVCAGAFPNLDFIDVREDFRAVLAGSGQLFYRTDHHLTSLGCHAAVSAISRST